MGQHRAGAGRSPLSTLMLCVGRRGSVAVDGQRDHHEER